VRGATRELFPRVSPRMVAHLAEADDFPVAENFGVDAHQWAGPAPAKQSEPQEVEWVAELPGALLAAELKASQPLALPELPA
jgi:hypothetical protein